ncbi:MAG: hypothetical protein ACPGVU_11165 [Limisphaerales bacterium]
MSMPLLDAALAFSLTMLLVATAVSQISSLVLGVMKNKFSVLEKLIQRFATKELKPIVDRHLQSLSDDAKVGVETALVKLTNDFQLSSFIDEDEIKAAVNATSHDVMTKLRNSELGKELTLALGDKAAVVFQDLATRYNALQTKFKCLYRNQARWCTTIIALILAVGLNIDTIRLANSYVRQQSVSAGAVAQMGAIMSNYETLAKTTTATNQVDQLHTAVKQSQTEIENLQHSGVPMGWQYFPYGTVGAPKEDPDGGKGNQIRAWGMWIFGILLTGMFAGLGAPFWYDAIKGISSFSQALRTMKQGGSSGSSGTPESS